ncbi:hypothetical protein Tco_1353682 [Tanacetum coccineum]
MENSGLPSPNLATKIEDHKGLYYNPKSKVLDLTRIQWEQWYNGNRNLNQTNQVNLELTLALTPTKLKPNKKKIQAPGIQVPVTYARFEAYTKANDVTLNNLKKNLNDFKREQQDFQNEQSYLNPLFEDDEEIISIEVSRKISPKVNSEPSIDDMSFSPKELNVESLPKDDNDDDLFEMDFSK